jgi:putative ABC transport system permease protein
VYNWANLHLSCPSNHNVLNDLTFTFRSLRRQPAFTLAAVATLAVGIGATTAIFSTVNAALLRPLPYPRSDDLRALYAPATDGRFTTGRDSGVEITRLNNPAFSIVHASGSQRGDATIIRDDGTPLPAVLFAVTDGFFELFGLPMSAGRAFTPQEHLHGTSRSAVLSYRLWHDLFGGNPGVVGKPIRLAEGPVTIVGVAARDFDIPHGADLWINAVVTPQSIGHGFDGYLRVKPGTTPERLRDEMASAMSSLAEQYGTVDRNRRYDVRPLASAIVGDLGPMLVVVLGGASVLLVLACVNVTNLLLARGAVRAREIAVRVALGAGRGRVVRQLLTESLVLSAAGTLVGLLLAFLGVRLLLVLGASELPRLSSVPFDLRVLAFSLVSMLVVGIFVGFAPALRLAGTNLRTLMNESGRSMAGGTGAHRMLKTMVVAEIALAIALVASAGWLVRSFANLGTANPGFVADGRLVFDLTLPFSKFPGPDLPARATAWSRNLVERLRAISGVTAAGTTSTFPLRSDYDAVLYVGVQGDRVDPEHPLVARAHRVSPDFFDAMGTRMLAGRAFTADDRQDTALVTIVNRSFARRYFGGRDPLTMRFTAGYPEPSATAFTVVGVVDDVKYVSMGEAADPAFYMPQPQSVYLRQTVVLRTSLGDPTTIAPTVRAAIRDMDPQIPVDFRSLTDIVSASLSRQRLGMTLMLLFATAALALAAVGIYGVIAYASAQRVGEVATRMALGATPSNVFWLMMRQGRTLAVIGTAVGLAVAYAAGRIVSNRLYEVRASDPLILAAATALVLGITLVAIVFPARRASQVDPSRVLRLD